AADAIEVVVVADDVLVVIALPEATGKRRPGKPLDALDVGIGRHRLEPRHDLAQRQSTRVIHRIRIGLDEEDAMQVVRHQYPRITFRHAHHREYPASTDIAPRDTPIP